MTGLDTKDHALFRALCFFVYGGSVPVRDPSCTRWLWGRWCDEASVATLLSLGYVRETETGRIRSTVEATRALLRAYRPPRDEAGRISDVDRAAVLGRFPHRGDLSVARFCIVHDIAPATLRRWRSADD